MGSDVYMKEQRSEFRLINEWWMFCIVSLSLIKSTKLLTCSLCWLLPLNTFNHLLDFAFVSFGSVVFQCIMSHHTTSSFQFLDSKVWCHIVVIERSWCFDYEELEHGYNASAKRTEDWINDFGARGPGNVHKVMNITACPIFETITRRDWLLLFIVFKLCSESNFFFCFFLSLFLIYLLAFFQMLDIWYVLVVFNGAKWRRMTRKMVIITGNLTLFFTSMQPVLRWANPQISVELCGHIKR